jgi:hypothetical protein
MLQVKIRATAEPIKPKKEATGGVSVVACNKTESNVVYITNFLLLMCKEKGEWSRQISTRGRGMCGKHKITEGVKCCLTTTTTRVCLLCTELSHTHMSKMLPIFTVDAFTAVSFAGNPAAVCLVDRGAQLSEKQMLRIASEMRHSETAFLMRDTATSDDIHTYRLRWFTPRVEVNLCGTT